MGDIHIVDISTENMLRMIVQGHEVEAVFPKESEPSPVLSGIKRNIVYELQEDGVSGHKVRAEKRDKIQKVKELARAGKFDIFLVFMFDRIGRISDETPFVVEWLVSAGIRVWSAEEGEQRIETHTDRLMNYIRFWQADGESQKTSIRTATRMGHITAEGHFTGGVCPYGYSLEKQGRVNKRGVELNELVINEDEAPIVRMMFEKYVTEGCGPQRMANYLRQINVKDREGKNWHPATIRGILRNPTYTGVLRSGESRSPVMPNLQIIKPELFEQAQEIIRQRSGKYEGTRTVPHTTKGRALLSGNIFCGHCGARLCTTTSSKYRPRKDGTDAIRIRYSCQTKTRRHEECDGQTGYTVHIVDEMIDDMVHSIFQRIGAVSQAELVGQACQNKLAEKQANVRRLQRELAKTEKDIQNLKDEILKALAGQSPLTVDMLGKLLKEQTEKQVEQRAELATATEQAAAEESIMRDMERRYNQFVEWADLYDGASLETKKMIVAQLFTRIEVSRGYKLKVEFSISVEQFLGGLDKTA